MCSPLDILIIPHFVGFVKRFFQLFFKPFLAKLCWVISLLTHSLQHISCRLSRGFFNFFHNPLGVGFSCHSLSTLIFYHRMSQKSMGNVAQKREKYKRFICAICLLTNCWGLCYNKISAPTLVSAAPKNEMEKPHHLGGVSIRRADRPV